MRSCAELRAAIELSFEVVSVVTPGIHVLDGVHIPQGEWVDFDPMVSMAYFVTEMYSTRE